MGRFDDMYCFEVNVDDSGEIMPFSNRWTCVRQYDLDYRIEAFMAPFDEKTLFVYGGIYSPGIERAGYDVEGNRQAHF